MNRFLKVLATAIGLALAAGCASYRNTALDHRLPPFKAPALRLEGLKSVQTRAGQDPETAIAVAISGGGHRAANLATGILLGLEEMQLPESERNVLQEVDYFSTVSGGGFAAGTYIAALHDHLDQDDPSAFRLADALAQDEGRRLYNLRRDYQNTVLTQWIHWKCAGFRDGGDLMEERFDRYLLGSKYRADHRSLVLGDLFKPASSAEPVLLPYWIANATVYENGDRFMFTPAFLSHYRVQRYVHNMAYCRLNDDPFSLPLAVGMKTSASFPVVFPATTFKCEPEHDRLNPYLHLVDGGLSDNLGLQSGIELLASDPAASKILIVIDAYAQGEHPYSAYRTSPDGPGVAYRVMKMGLDAEHVRVRERAQAAAEEEGIRIVFLGFDELKPALDETMGDLEAEIKAMRQRKNEAMSRRLQRELKYALQAKETELDLVRATGDALYADARSVGTSLKITRGEQAVLLTAGQQIVERHRDALLGLLDGE